MSENFNNLDHTSVEEWYINCKYILLKNYKISSLWLSDPIELGQVMGLLPDGTTVKPLNINRTLIGNKIVGNSDAVWASPVGAAPTTS